MSRFPTSMPNTASTVAAKRPSAPNSPDSKHPADQPPAPPLSPVNVNVNLGAATIANAKDVRAYEHDRNRSKQAKELAKRKARKVLGADADPKASIRGEAVHGHGHVVDKAGKSRRSKVDVNVDIDLDVCVVDEVSAVKAGKGARVGMGMGIVEGLAAALRDTATSSPPLDVVEQGGIRANLSDLVVHSQRKPRKVKEDDFEVIPHVRAVIALDDAEENDMEVDEPWEHIQSEEDSDGKSVRGHEEEPSYANVVRTGLAGQGHAAMD